MGRAAATLACLLLGGLQPSAAGEEARCVRVVDGDTIVVRGQGRTVDVRLAFIDAPEARQPGGAAATAALRAMALGRRVEVTPIERDRYGRTVAAVRVGGRDLSAAMLTAGHAWQFRRYDRDPERRLRESEARADGRGLWAAPAEPPWAWREGSGTPLPSSVMAEGCARRTCRQIPSCEEARRQLRVCHATWLDGDGDGTPCETLCRG